MSNSVEIVTHLPSCWVEEWVEVQPHPAQLPFLASPVPIPIWVTLSTPTALTDLSGSFANIHQLEIVGTALLATLEALKPRFHISYVNGKLLQASGTTIIITGYSGRFVVFGTWDHGEDVSSALGRLSEMRRICQLPAPLANALLTPRQAELPAPQAILSNVIPSGIECPPMPLGAYGAASTPIAIAVGTKEITVTMDHRLQSPPDEAVFRTEFAKRIHLEVVGDETT